MKNMSMAEYLRIDALSSGVCHTLLTESPLHAKWRKENPSESSNASDVGTIAHQILLEGNSDGVVIVDADDYRTKAAKEAREAAYAAGHTPILASKMPLVLNMVDAAKAFVAESEIAGIFDVGVAESTVMWDEDGLPCKARPDLLDAEWHLSVKTTEGSANPYSYTKFRLSQLGHDLSLAFYDRGLKAIGKNVEHRILLIEQFPPHGCCVFGLAPSKWDYVTRRVDRAIGIWRRCLSTGLYPAYPLQTCFAEAQPWEMANEEEAQLSETYDSIQAEHGIQA
jgi:hypothetical protein